jgi:hypothetical protein
LKAVTQPDGSPVTSPPFLNRAERRFAMIRLTKILVATDFSEPSDAAVVTAISPAAAIAEYTRREQTDLITEA